MALQFNPQETDSPVAERHNGGDGETASFTIQAPQSLRSTRTGSGRVAGKASSKGGDRVQSAPVETVAAQAAQSGKSAGKGAVKSVRAKKTPGAVLRQDAGAAMTREVPATVAAGTVASIDAVDAPVVGASTVGGATPGEVGTLVAVAAHPAVHATDSLVFALKEHEAGHGPGRQNGQLLAGRVATREGRFELVEPYAPAGDQPGAIAGIVEGLRRGDAGQTILGATGTGKTYTLAHIIAEVQRPTIVMAPNKTLAAQLYSEFRDFFPNNAVEYFVSYYDYYQPEAYVPSRDLFIEKDSAVNAQIEQMRLSATKALLERKDALIVATVSAIYGLGSPESYYDMILTLRTHAKMTRRDIITKLVKMQYGRSDTNFRRGSFRARGDIIDIFPSESPQDALRVELFDDEIESIKVIDPLTGAVSASLNRFNVYPASHYAAPESAIKRARESIKKELEERLAFLRQGGRAVEAARLEQRTLFDLEMMEEIGFCKGIENYSRHMNGKNPGDPPDTLFDYLPQDGLLVLDESHLVVPQIGAMFKGDRARKENLVEYGFRLPSALDNRPLKFDEFEKKMPQTVFVSATPADYEATNSASQVELVIRPTGILDPEIEVKPATTQVDDLLEQIRVETAKGGRVLVTSLTKRMSEKLSEFLLEHSIKAKYLHSDIENVERARLIRDLRRGEFDVLIGINLLREGLDMPEVTLVAIMDADKEGFLRSTRSLIQTIGRAARNPEGRVILYADRITDSMQRAMDETQRRREKQAENNALLGVVPKRAGGKIKDILEEAFEDPLGGKAKKGKKADRSTKKTADQVAEALFDEDPAKLSKILSQMEKAMREAAADLDFEKASELRDQVKALRERAVLTPI